MWIEAKYPLTLGKAEIEEKNIYVCICIYSLLIPGLRWDWGTHSAKAVVILLNCIYKPTFSLCPSLVSPVT